MPFRFVHTSDLHLGRRFGNMPDLVRGRLTEERHGALARIAAAARSAGAGHVLVAGDVFDSETPADQVRRQALGAMADDPDLVWWLLPGNHDSLAAEALWSAVAEEAPPNVRPLATDAPVTLAPGVDLLPAPVVHRYPGRDLTDHMPMASSAEGTIRIGLAHGAVTDFGEGEPDAALIPPNRAESAGLDYLALGDWHGQRRIGPRCRYSGTPEQDRFKHDAPGSCLVVSIDAPGAAPEIADIRTGHFHWLERRLAFLPGGDAAPMLDAALPPSGRREVLMRVIAEGRLRLPEREALRRRAERVAPDFGHFALDDAALALEPDGADLDGIAGGGALRSAAQALLDEVEDRDRDAGTRRVAADALSRLYAYARDEA